jgi:hypothetical protein
MLLTSEKQRVKKQNEVVTRRPLLRSSIRILEYAILFLVVYQTLHVIDHGVQYYQKYVLNISNPPALFEGAFNESDTIIHAWINGILIISTFTIWIAFRRSRLKEMKQDLIKEKL